MHTIINVSDVIQYMPCIIWRGQLMGQRWRPQTSLAKPDCHLFILFPPKRRLSEGWSLSKMVWLHETSLKLCTEGCVWPSEYIPNTCIKLYIRMCNTQTCNTQLPMSDLSRHSDWHSQQSACGGSCPRAR